MNDLPNWLIALFLKPFVALVLVAAFVLIRAVWRSVQQARRERGDESFRLRTGPEQ